MSDPSAPDAAPASPLSATMGPNGAARPQDPPEPARCDRGQKKCHTVKTVRLINAALTILLLSET